MSTSPALAADASTHGHNPASSSSASGSNHHPPSPSAAASAAADRVYHEFTHYATDHPTTSSSASSSSSAANAVSGLQPPSQTSIPVDAAAAVAAAAAAAAVAASNAAAPPSESTPSGSMFPTAFAPDPNTAAAVTSNPANPDSSVISLNPNTNDHSILNHSTNETDGYDQLQQQEPTTLSQNQRSDAKDRNGSASAGPAVKPPSRAQRACVNCRKQKMRCVGADDSRSCNRCSAHGLECVFEKATKEVAATQQRELTEGVFERLGSLERELAETKALLLAVAVHLGVQAPALNPPTSSSSGPITPMASVGPGPGGETGTANEHHFFDDQTAALTAAAMAAAVSGTNSPLSTATHQQQQSTSASTSSGRKRGGAASATDSSNFLSTNDDQDASDHSDSRTGPDPSWFPPLPPSTSAPKRARLG
ncbi:hypothetical protein OC861_006326 [Tilletia horrida]|nr:hypothetical protein OC861_006326 [Tilletia horrida]